MNTMNFEIPKLGKKQAETDEQIKQRLRYRPCDDAHNLVTVTVVSLILLRV